MHRLFIVLLLVATLPIPSTAVAPGPETVMTAPPPSETMLVEALGAARVATRRAALLRIAGARLVRFETAARAALDDPAWSVRRMACRALEFVGTEASRESLERAARGSDSTPVRARAVMALGGRADSRSLPVLLDLLDDTDFAVRGTAAQQIGFFGDATVVARLTRLAESDSFPYVRVRALGSIDRLAPSPVPATATADAPGWPRWIKPILMAGAALLLLAVFGRRGTPPHVRRRLLMAALIISAATLLLVLLSRHDADRKATAYELILDPALAEHPLVRRSGGADSFGEEIARTIRSAGLGIDPSFRVAASPELEAAFEPLRGQYDMDRMLDAWAGATPVLPNDEARRAPTPIVVTGRHLFVEPYYTVLGRAARQGGVISTRWIDPAFLGETDLSDTEAVLFRRQLAQVLIHELGHARGLSHCAGRTCVMRSVEEAAEEFHRLDATPCATCRGKLERR